jgi:hypothetical protein
MFSKSLMVPRAARLHPSLNLEPAYGNGRTDLRAGETAVKPGAKRASMPAVREWVRRLSIREELVQPIDHFASPAAPHYLFERRRCRYLAFEQFGDLPADPSSCSLITFMRESELQIP